MLRYIVVLGMMGCSFIASRTPAGEGRCMPNRGAVAADAVVVASAAVVDIESAGCRGDGCIGWIIPDAIMTLVAIPYIASAIYGSSVHTCRSQP